VSWFYLLINNNSTAKTKHQQICLINKQFSIDNVRYTNYDVYVTNNSNTKTRKEGHMAALTVTEQDVIEKMKRAIPHMSEKALAYMSGAAEVLLLQHEPDPDEPTEPEDTEKKPA
jgi:hypothetical protein